MDDEGYAFTPMAFLLIIPVIVLAVSFNGVINELSIISAIAVGGDVTATIASNIVKAVELDTQDAGRFAAFTAVQTVVNETSLYAGNQPFFGKTGNNSTGNNSKAFVVQTTTNILNKNITETCRVLERQTGRDIYINNIYVDPNSTDTLNVFNANNLSLSQLDPFGFYITVNSVPVRVVQRDASGKNNQSVSFNTPVKDVYVSIEKLEDPWIWVMTKNRNSSVIYRYPYYTSSGAISGATSPDYHFADQKSVIPGSPPTGRLNYLWECFIGANESAMGVRPYYFSDPHGLSFFDRLENRTNNTSASPPEARMSTFIVFDPLKENYNNAPISMLDHEYFEGISGTSITVNGALVTVPSGVNFLLSPAYKTYLGLSNSYTI